MLLVKQEEAPTQAPKTSWLLLLRQYFHLSQRDVSIAFDVTERTFRYWEKNPDNEPKLTRFQWKALRKLCHCTTQEELEALIDKLLESSA